MNSVTLYAPLSQALHRRTLTAPSNIITSFLSVPTSTVPLCPPTVKFALLPVPSRSTVAVRAGTRPVSHCMACCCSLAVMGTLVVSLDMPWAKCGGVHGVTALVCPLSLL